MQRELSGRELPRVAVPADSPSAGSWNRSTGNPERAAWRDALDSPGGLVTAADGALVLMAHLRFPARIGVWLQPEGRVIHCGEQHGVCCESVLALRYALMRLPRQTTIAPSRSLPAGPTSRCAARTAHKRAAIRTSDAT